MNANKKAKSVLAALLAGMMVFASACNQGTTNSSEPAGDSSAAEESGQQESSEGTSEKSHILFWDMAWGGPDTYVPAMEEVLSAVNSEFADQLDGEIEYVNLPWDNFYQVHLTAVNSGTAPDIFAAGYGTAETFARMGEIYYMDNLDADEEFASKFSEAIWESRRYEGKLVQLPYMVGIDMLYYRTDMFAEVGYTESPKTWDEFMDALRKVKEKFNIDPFIFELSGGQANHLALMSLINNGTGACKYDAENNVVSAMSDESALHMYDYWIQMYQEGLVPKSLSSYKRTDLTKIYLDGQAAVIIHDTAQDLAADPEIAAVTGVMDVLTGPDTDEKRACTFINGIGVFAQSKNPQLAEQICKSIVVNSQPIFTNAECGEWPTYEGISVSEDFAFAKEGSKILDYMTPATYPLSEVYDGWSVIDGEALLGKVAQMAFTGASSDPAEIGAYGDELVQDAIASQQNQ